MEVIINWNNGEDNFYMGMMHNFYMGMMPNFCGLRGHKNCKIYTDWDKLGEDISNLIDNGYHPLSIEKVGNNEQSIFNWGLWK